MTIDEFLAQLQSEIRERAATGEGQPYSEFVFTERVMEHLADIGATSDPVTCHYSAKVDRAEVRLSGYAVSADGEALDLFVSLYSGEDTPMPIADKDVMVTAERCLRFLSGCVEGDLAAKMDKANDAYVFAETLRQSYALLEIITIHVLTDRVAKSKNFKSREIAGKAVRLEVMDIERLHRHMSEGRPRDEVVMDFLSLSGGPLPCVLIPGEQAAFATVLVAIPGEALRASYDRFGARLLEANIRSFLPPTRTVNRGIRDTLRKEPENFIAFNNGVVIVADEAGYQATADGGPGLSWLRGAQVVNGGQTTASIYFTKRKAQDTDLSRVRVPAKIIIIASGEGEEADAARDDLARNVAQFANQQNVVKASDLSATGPLQRRLERLCQTTYCPDGTTRWFYERAAGSYNVMLMRKGDTPARLKRVKEEFPPARKITKTELAQYLMAWAGEPHIVSKGLQENFRRFDLLFNNEATSGRWPLETPQDYKRLIAQSIIFRTVQRIVRPAFRAFQANITVYTVALLGIRLGDRIDLDRIWMQQTLSPALSNLAGQWAVEVDRALQKSAEGRMISEWAKRPECWDTLRQMALESQPGQTPEMRPSA